jgi:hypothetical protein
MAKKQGAALAPKNVPSHGVFVVENDGPNAYWTRIGCAWAHSDGEGFNIQLSAVPMSGRIVLRTRREKEGGE